MCVAEVLCLCRPRGGKCGPLLLVLRSFTFVCGAELFKEKEAVFGGICRVVFSSFDFFKKILFICFRDRELEWGEGQGVREGEKQTLC